MGGLRLDSRDQFLRGGQSGPVAVPGSPDASLLVKALRYDANPKMPPSGKLAADQIAAVEAWIKSGAVWPENEKSAVKSPPYNITAEQRAFWSFQPVKPVSPPEVKDANWARTEIDRFLAAKLEAQGIAPGAPSRSPHADSPRGVRSYRPPSHCKKRWWRSNMTNRPTHSLK